jgi:restriction system protein
VGYRLVWARTYLKKFAFLENSTRDVWALTKLAKEAKRVNSKEVVRQVRDADKESSKQKIRKPAKLDIELSDSDTPEADGPRTLLALNGRF